MENLNTKILNKGENRMSNKTQVWVNDWIETETNKIDFQPKRKRKVSQKQNVSYGIGLQAKQILLLPIKLF